MARARQTRKQPSRLSEQVVKTLRESALWVFAAFALLLWFALITYDPSDPGFTQASSNGEIENGVGRFGALLADLLFNLFGRPAYLFPVMVFYFGWMIFREQKTNEHYTRADYTLRFIGFVATLLTSCALATLHFSPVGFRETAGGIIGQVVGNNLESVMKLLGASVLLFFVWVAAVSVFLGISWLTVMDRVGHWCLVGYEKAREKVGEFRDRAEGKRQLAARQNVFEQEKKRTAGRTPPKIEPTMAQLEPSARAEKERQVPLFEPPSDGELPPLSLLDDPAPQGSGYSEESLEAMSRLVELKLRDFGIEVEVVSVSPGPIITRFEMRSRFHDLPDRRAIHRHWYRSGTCEVRCEYICLFFHLDNCAFWNNLWSAESDSASSPENQHRN